MAGGDSGSRTGGKPGQRRPPEKTFGDARLGIPAGGRAPDRPAQRGSAETKPRAAGSETEETVPEKKGPIVERLGGGPARPLPPVVKPVAKEGEPAPERVFRRAPLTPEKSPEPPPALEEPLPVERESFAEMFARSSAGGHGRVAPGQRLSGRILQIGRETTFLELAAAAGGHKTEALIDTRELRGDDGELKFEVGAEITGYVKSLEDGIWLTTALPKGAQREALQAARQSGLPVEGTVTALNKGGLEVDLGSGTRGFVPSSQASLRFTPDLSGMVGQRLQFLVTEIKDRDIVLSRRALLEREGREKAEALRDTLVPGMQLEGTVTSLREFGAFIDLGGIDGLVPISELAHRRVGHPEEVLAVGQTVTVEVLRVEPAGPDAKNDRIALSLKRLEEDPWMVLGNAIVEGQRFKGKIVRLQPFGAFVELSPGVDGLIHVSRLVSARGGRVTHPDELLKEGQELWVEVDTIDRASRKIGLRPLSDAEAALPPPPRAGPPRVGDAVDATVDKVEGFGLFVRWPGGRGLVPVSEMGPRAGDLRRTHPLGTKIKVQIVDIDPQGRIRLSAVAAVQAEERAQVDEYLKDNQPKGLGTFADLLKKK